MHARNVCTIPPQTIPTPHPPTHRLLQWSCPRKLIIASLISNDEPSTSAVHVLSLLKKLTPVLTENITSPAKMNEVTQSASRLKWGLHVNVFFSAHSPLSTGSTTPAPSNYHVRRLSFIFNFIFLVLLPEASFGLRVLSLPPSVCLCVCVCGNHLLVRAITCRPFKLESPNLDQKSKTPWLRSLLFWGLIDLELQGQI